MNGQTMNDIHLQQRTTNIYKHHLQLNVIRFVNTKVYYDASRKLTYAQEDYPVGHLPTEYDWPE